MQKVKIDNVIPFQQPAARKILRSADCYQQKFIKFPKTAITHSYSELLHLGLLESDTKVSSFVPQPFQFRVGKRRYIPDCFYVREGKKYVAELKPEGTEFDHIEVPVSKFLEKHGMTFLMITNESVIKESTLANNWLYIVRVLCTSQTIGTE